MQAANRHEDAAALYSKLLAGPGTGRMRQQQLTSFMVECCCEAYSAVSDWEGLQEWLQEVKVSLVESA